MLGLVGLIVGSFACGDPPVDDTVPTSSRDGGKGGGDGGTVVLPDGAVVHGKSQSCTGGPGADKKCGGDPNDPSKEGTQDCCEARAIPGGKFNRFNDASYPATISPFTLDTFELTAGRFRAWVDATNGNLRSSSPPAGGGAHPKIPNSGWRDEWAKYLPSSRAEVDKMLGPELTEGGFMACQFGTDIDDQGALTWWTDDLDKAVKDRNKGKTNILAENTKEALDKKPLNCIPWHVLFAFCYWDGGRLPTDAEFSFAASGGSEQRQFPWGNLPANEVAHIDGDRRQDLSLVPIFEVGQKYASARLYDKTLGQNLFEDNYSFTYGGKVMGKSDNAAHIPPVGRKPLGNGKWGHADLSGGMFEWVLDEGPAKQGECNDCANVNWPANEAKDPSIKEEEVFKNPGGIDWYKGGARPVRGGAWDNAQGFANGQTKLEVDYFGHYPVLRTYRAVGGRCARDY